MPTIEEFRALTDATIAELTRLERTITVLQFTQVLAEIAPKLRTWSEQYQTFRESDETTQDQAADIGDEFQARLKQAFGHKTSLSFTSAPAAGGKRRYQKTRRSKNKRRRTVKK